MAISLARELNVSRGAAYDLIRKYAEIQSQEDMLLRRGMEINIEAADGFPPAVASAGAIWDVAERSYFEFFNSIRKKLEAREIHEDIDCVLLCGEAARVEGLVQLARKVFGSTARPATHDWQKKLGDDPALPRLRGLLQMALENRPNVDATPKQGREGDVVGKMKSWLKGFFD
jgi:cell division ATPase FtsA